MVVIEPAHQHTERPCHKGWTHTALEMPAERERERETWIVSLSICMSHVTILPAIQEYRFHEMCPGIMNNPVVGNLVKYCWLEHTYKCQLFAATLFVPASANSAFLMAVKYINSIKKAATVVLRSYS